MASPLCALLFSILSCLSCLASPVCWGSSRCTSHPSLHMPSAARERKVYHPGSLPLTWLAVDILYVCTVLLFALAPVVPICSRLFWFDLGMCSHSDYYLSILRHLQLLLCLLHCARFLTTRTLSLPHTSALWMLGPRSDGGKEQVV